jgi:hypothetical protein
MNNKTLLVKKLRAVKVDNWRDQTDFTRRDDHPEGKIFYERKHFDSYTPALITPEQMMKDIVNYKEAGYRLVLLEK